MVIRGNQKRLTGIIIFGVAFALASTYCAFQIKMRGWDMHYSYILLGFAFLSIIVIRAFTSRARVGYITLHREGLSILVGFRPVFITWENIEAIEISELKKKTFLGIKVKSLEGMRKAIYNIALIQKESTGYHFCLGGEIFEKRLHEVHSTLLSYWKNENSRQSLPEADIPPPRPGKNN